MLFLRDALLLNPVSPVRTSRVQAKRAIVTRYRRKSAQKFQPQRKICATPWKKRRQRFGPARSESCAQTIVSIGYLVYRGSRRYHDHWADRGSGQWWLASPEMLRGKRFAPKTRPSYNSINASPTITVGTSAAKNRPSGEIPASPKRDARMLCPAGLGALAITVKPPPLTAPAITA
jgi:hypothetical protein